MHYNGTRCTLYLHISPHQAASDKAVKEAIAAGVIDAIKKLRAFIEAVPLNEVELHPVDTLRVREKALDNHRNSLGI